MIDSIHLARYIEKNISSNKNFVYILIGSTPSTRIHPKIIECIKDGKMYYFYHKRFIVDILIQNAPCHILKVLSKLFSKKLQSSYESNYQIRNYQNFVKQECNIIILHIFEMQWAGYMCLNDINFLKEKTKIYYTNYGSDIAYFGKFPDHLLKINDLLSKVDLYFSECKRDIEIVKKLGYQGRIAPLNLNSPINTSKIWKVGNLSKTSTRRIISIKAYDSFVGRSVSILDALLELSSHLEGFKLVFFSASHYFRDVIAVPQLVNCGIQHEIYLHGSLNEVQMYDLLTKSRIILSNSKCDGVSTSILEGIINGAYPITSSSGCLADWVELGENNLFDWRDFSKMKSNILEALSNDQLVDNFFSNNSEKVIQLIEKRQNEFTMNDVYRQ
jgi:glycosyltransferase involved in cell wall biosynthesis